MFPGISPEIREQLGDGIRQALVGAPTLHDIPGDVTRRLDERVERPCEIDLDKWMTGIRNCAGVHRAATPPLCVPLTGPPNRRLATLCKPDERYVLENSVHPS